MFATWFTYALDGTPMWLSVTAEPTPGGVYAGTLYLTRGPPFNATPFLPANVVLTSVGDATFKFADGNNAAFAYSVTTASGTVTQTKTLTRQVLRPPGTLCK